MNVKTDLKGFYVGNRKGIAIYVGSTKVWPIPQGTTVVDPCSYIFSNYDGTINDIQRDWMGRGSGTE